MSVAHTPVEGSDIYDSNSTGWNHGGSLIMAVQSAIRETIPRLAGSSGWSP